MTESIQVGTSLTSAPPVRIRRPRAARSARASARTDTLGRALGWFSVGLGLAELLAPRALARTIGAPHNPALMRALGLRELTSGIGILAHGHGAWLQSRVVGDVIDLALLGAAARERGSDPRKLAVASALVMGVTSLDVVASLSDRSAASPPHLIQTIAISRTPAELYPQLRELSNMPRLLGHVGAVRTLDERRSHWSSRAIAGTTLEWDIELTADQPDRRIAWRTVPGSDLPHHGSIELQPMPAQRGTILRLELDYAPSSSRALKRAVALLGKMPSLQIQNDLRRFKQWVEVGEIATTEGQSSGRRSPLSALLP